jgi:hypothetical protein
LRPFIVSDYFATEPNVEDFGNFSINKSNPGFVATDDVQREQVDGWQFLRDDEGKVKSRRR